jgi:hypothetical protein
MRGGSADMAKQRPGARHRRLDQWGDGSSQRLIEWFEHLVHLRGSHHVGVSTHDGSMDRFVAHAGRDGR